MTSCAQALNDRSVTTMGESKSSAGGEMESGHFLNTGLEWQFSFCVGPLLSVGWAFAWLKSWG